MKIKTLYPFALTAAVSLLSLYVMLKNTYLTNGGFPIFAEGAVICCFMLLTVYKLFGCGKAFWGTGSSAVILLGNITAVPMLFYTDRSGNFSAEDIAAEANTVLICLILTYISMIAAGVSLYFINKFNASKNKLLSGIAAGVTLLAAVVIFFMSDTDSGTTLIFDIQAAVPAAALMILCAAVAVSSVGALKILCTAAFIALNAAIIIRNETGIPAAVFGAMLVWYLFFAKKRSKILTFLSVLIPASAAAGLLFLKHFGSRFEEFPIVDKVMTRLFSGNVEQAATARESLCQSGIFGAENYLHLNEGTSDFCMVTLIHYLGISFLLLTALSAVPFLYSSAGELMKERCSLSNTVASMSLSLLTVILIYNLLMCVGIAPIIGVQAPFVGKSGTFSILSGVLLGWSCFSETEADKLCKKIKDMRSELL